MYYLDKNSIVRIYLALFILLLAASCGQKNKNISSIPNAKAPYTRTRPQNIVLMIGDGMGISQITAGLYSNGNQLNIERFTTVGIIKTYSSNELITDSAAAATSFASGIKTYNGAIGVDTDTSAVETILEIAEKAGMSTGLIATSSITHATPAAFIAHNENRNNHEAIAEDFLKTDVDLLIGGGKKYFNNREKDDLNLLSQFEEKGYTIIDHKENLLNELPVFKGEKIVYFTSNESPSTVQQGRSYLPQAGKFSMTFLKEQSKENGFFAMIEGSQIDWGGHANDKDYIISEVLDFDQTIGEVLDFAQNDGETLVIVTADHETGGFAINPGSTMDTIISGFTTSHHTANLIPLFAYGPGSEIFQGIYENTAVFDKMKTLLATSKID